MIKKSDSGTKLKEKLQTFLSNLVHSWWQQRGLMAHLLYPLSCLTQLIVKSRQSSAARSRAWKAHVPVIVIGNIYLGGTGKTPVVIACARTLAKMGWKPGIVSRGYGVDVGTQPRVSKSHFPSEPQKSPDPRLFGDEPALIALASGCPIAVHPKRRLAIETLLRDCPEIDLIISDDGLQHVEMGRDIEIIVQDDRGVGNGWLLPAGPLREPVMRLSQVDVVMTRVQSLVTRDISPDAHSPIGSDTNKSQELFLHPAKPRCISMTLEPIRFRNVLTGQTIDLKDMQSFAHGKKVGAAAGIGVPQRFFDTLISIGMPMNWVRPLPDHVTLDGNTFAENDAQLIFITEKDAIKCGSFRDDRLWALEVEARFNDSDFFPWLDQRLRQAASSKQLPHASTIRPWKQDC